MLSNLKCTDCEEKLSDYLERDLGEDARASVERHLHSCLACRELLTGMSSFIDAGRSFPLHTPPPWLPLRIVANTPRPQRASLRSLPMSLWQALGDSRAALAIFTAVVVIGWVGGETGRDSILNRAEGSVNCAYDHAVRSYYRSPVVIEILSRIDQLMENS